MTMNRPHTGEGPRFRERLGRMKNCEPLVQTLRPVFAAKPSEYGAQRLSEHTQIVQRAFGFAEAEIAELRFPRAA